MTRRDFAAVAQVIKDQRDTNVDPHVRSALVVTARRMAHQFALNHPRFDQSKFLVACGVEEPIERTPR